MARHEHIIIGCARCKSVTRGRIPHREECAIGEQVTVECTRCSATCTVVDHRARHGARAWGRFPRPLSPGGSA